MSFIYSYFAGDNSTSAEKENAAALRAMVKDHKTALKAEVKLYEAEYKQTLDKADEEYKRVKVQAKAEMFRKTMDALKREVDIITATDEFANSDTKTKGKIEGFRSWMSSAEEKHCGDEKYKTAPVDEKQPELVYV
ncbi:hypothetical protein BC939DRAFT_526645 [Gamsiella multidivaricata]|uniref:uncharacterized protein n=1 Tax=Gamsiella multidivaricata TaxID=101098 RepID=UPI00221FB9B0|nr:uncharacterized protein BC939DRAFT_526645 [Gamsiella multidivaricata]KAG0354356.1 hypothetical protein BGZ54_001683 [Gamsiella multidivaricata]KAI7828551.1 hypothetical protein BC939DRAFT_526645 [Gamsiella multidivaricata]